jgi:TolB-like protein/DNA-binding winged helix-turn-helix (wHTH) protein
MIYRFAGSVLNIQLRELTVEGTPVHVEPQVFDVLRYLVENRDRVISRDELVDAVWQGRIVSEATIGTRIFAARRAVGDTGEVQAVIQTLPRRGFRFVASVNTDGPSRSELALASAESPPPSGPEGLGTNGLAPAPGSSGLAAQPSQPSPSRSHLPLAVMAASVMLLLVGAGSVAVWQLWEAQLEAASLGRMAFPLPRKPSIAVLPFTNLNKDAAQDLMGEGLTDGLVNTLARNPSVFVIAYSSTIAYAGQSGAVKRAAEELGVRYVVEGSIKRAGSHVRVTTQLVDALNGRVLWSERYDRVTDDFLALKDEIPARIARSLDLRINYAGDQSSGGTRNPDASTAYLQGRNEYLKFTRAGNSRAREHYLRAIKFDPNYAQAMVALAHSYFIEMVGARAEDWGRSLAKIARLQDQAARIAPGMPRLFELRSMLALTRGDHDLALTEAEAMAALDPNGAESHYVLGRMYFFTKQYQRAIDSLATAERINPNNRASYSSHMAFAHLALRKVDVATSILEAMAKRWPEFSPGRAYLAIVYQLAGRQSEARQQAALLTRAAPDVTVLAIERRFSPMQDRGFAARMVDAARQAGIPE